MKSAMTHQIYINYTKSMEVACGMLRLNPETGRPVETNYARPVRPAETILLACIDIFTDGEDFPAASMIDSIIDEGFRKIGKLKQRTWYREATGSGQFEIIWRPGFPGDPESVKHAVHDVVARLHGFGEQRGHYCGKPAQLFRYSERRFLEESLTRGRFLIKPATAYDDLVDDDGRQDNELRREFPRDPHSLIITTLDGTVLQPKGPVHFVNTRAADYYVLCLSMEYSRTAEAEFTDIDACLLIKDPAAFAERLHAGIETVLENWAGLEAPVSYGEKSVYGVCFTKPVRHEAQGEFRFAWTPTDVNNASPRLKEFFIEIGSIEDIAEIRPLPSQAAGTQ